MPTRPWQALRRFRLKRGSCPCPQRFQQSLEGRSGQFSRFIAWQVLDPVDGAGKKYRINAVGQGLQDLLLGERGRHHECGKPGVFLVFLGGKKKTVVYPRYAE